MGAAGANADTNTGAQASRAVGGSASDTQVATGPGGPVGSTPLLRGVQHSEDGQLNMYKGPNHSTASRFLAIPCAQGCPDDHHSYTLMTEDGEISECTRSYSYGCLDSSSTGSCEYKSSQTSCDTRRRRRSSEMYLVA